MPLALAGALLPCSQPADAAGSLSFSRVWTYDHALGSVPGQTSEIAAFDSSTGTIWVAGVIGLDVLDATTGSLVQHVDTSPFGNANSVAIHGGLAAVAIESSVDRTQPGTVKFYDTASRALAAGVNSVTVGALPDMVTFTPGGEWLLVANEATPTTYGGYDPAGSVSVIDMTTRTVSATAGFGGVPVSGPDVRTAATVGMDFEPEYIAVNASGTRAYVTLQEANAVGTLDIASGSFTGVVGLGTKDFIQPGNEIDPSHKDGTIALRSADVRGLYQPDSIAAYEANGQTYLVMANEGDTREDDGDKARVKDVPALAGTAPADLQQLNVSTVDSTSGTDLVTFGGRSFSIRDEAGDIVFDSGNRLDAEAIARGIYDDGRSDDKGVEPEGVAVRTIDGRTYAFIGLERTLTGAVAVYDITDPASATFLDMLVTDGDVAPEGLVTFSMGGTHYLAIANEVSGTTTLYSMAPVPEPGTWAMMVAGLGLLGAAARRRPRSA
ncbi:MAG: PEP-CTERM sorting domain-containing protein [Betaproteobacteria bacterium]|nr:PEP-CTERM sorting domain-containing protein [Betaproteobacteria bacterium]